MKRFFIFSILASTFMTIGTANADQFMKPTKMVRGGDGVCQSKTDFKKVDVNNDGVINESDFEAYFAAYEAGRAGKADINCDTILDQGDINLYTTLYASLTNVDELPGFDPEVAQKYPNIFLADTVLRSPLLAVNLEKQSYYSAQWAYCNIAKNLGADGKWYSSSPGSLGFTPGNFAETDQGLPIATNGQAALGMMFRDVGGAYPSGTYTITYDGQATVEALGDGKIVERPTANSAVMQVTPSNNGIFFQIHSVNPSDPIRNLEIMMPESENCTGKFHPLFIERLKPFSALRFAYNTKATSKGITSLEQIDNDIFTANENRMPFSDLLEIANLTGMNAWINVPYEFDAEEVQKMAALVGNKLNSNLKVYVEYGVQDNSYDDNQAKWLLQQGVNLGYTNGSDPVQNRNAIAKLSVEKIKEFSDIFAQELGRDRIKVMSSSIFADEALAQNLDVDVLLVNVSYTSNNELSPEDYFNNMVYNHNYSYSNEVRNMENLENALGHPVELFANTVYTYDNMYAENESLSTVQNAQSDARAFDAAYENMRRFKQAGGSTMAIFDYTGKVTRYDLAGHLNAQDAEITSPEAHKMRAALQFAIDNQ